MNLQEILDKRLHPSDGDSGFYDEDTGAGVHIRADGCLEIYAGSASILLDGKSGAISINGKVINSSAEKIIANPASRGFHVDTGYLNPKWLPNSMEAMAGKSIPILSQMRSPLVALPHGLDFPLLTGVPAQGQTQVNLRELLQAVELFMPKNRISEMASAVAKAIAGF